MNELERWLAEQAKTLGLDAVRVEAADPETLRDYCRAVLTQLAARGLLAGPETVGCYATRRQKAN